MSTLIKNSKETTIAGICTFGIVLLQAIMAQFDGNEQTIPDWNVVVLAAGVLIGLWRARDNNKSSEKVGAK